MTLIVLSTVMFLYTASESTIISWLPSLLTVTRSVPKPNAAALLGLFWLGELITRFAMFYFPVGRSVPAVIYTSLSLSLIGLVLLSMGVAGALLIPLVCLVGLAFGPLWPSIVAVARMADVASSLTIRVIAIGGIGAAVGPILSSRVIGRFGIESVLPFVAVLAVLELAAFLVFSLHERGVAERLKPPGK